MRPQDIAILLKLCAMGNAQWQLVPLSAALKISISEISESLNRSRLAKLVDYSKKQVNRQNFLEFLEHGVQYVFPQQPGSIGRGIPTAHAHPKIKKSFVSDMAYVWPDQKGSVMGQLIEPLYARQSEAIKDDPKFYEMLALVDMIRAGRVREVKYAVASLKKLIHEPPY
jgi:hypothetical protein